MSVSADHTVAKFHSAIRWGKEVDELKTIAKGVKDTLGLDAAESADPQNGNRALHLASQNGHMNIVRWLVEECKVDVNSQNGKGQTPLHMSVAYDFYFVTKLLLKNNAKQDVKNGDDNLAITGIDGDHELGNPKTSWDAPINSLKAVSSQEEML